MKRHVLLVVALALFLGGTTAWGGQILYVSNYGSNTVSEVTASGTVTTFFSSGLNRPQGLAFDGQGNLYIANDFGHSISEVTSSGTLLKTISLGTSYNPMGLAFNQGNLYVASSDSTVSKVAANGTVSNLPFGFSYPADVAFDTHNNLYVSNQYGFISKVTPGGTMTTFVSGLSMPAGLAFDSNGNLYVACEENNKVYEYSSSGSLLKTISSTLFDEPDGLAFDAQGNLYVANYGSNTVSEVTTGGTITTFAKGFDDPTFLAFGPNVTPVPEPASMTLFGIGIGVLGYTWRRRKPVA